MEKMVDGLQSMKHGKKTRASIFDRLGPQGQEQGFRRSSSGREVEEVDATLLVRVPVSSSEPPDLAPARRPINERLAGAQNLANPLSGQRSLDVQRPLNSQATEQGDLREQLNARRAVFIANRGTLKQAEVDGGHAQRSGIHEALAKRLEKRKAPEDAEPPPRRALSPAEQDATLISRGSDPQAAEVYCTGCGRTGHVLDECRKRKSAQSKGGRVQEGSALYLCAICNAVCASMPAHKQTKAHLDEEEKQDRTGIFQCNLCAHPCSNEQDLFRHVQGKEHLERRTRRIQNWQERPARQDVETRSGVGISHGGDRQRQDSRNVRFLPSSRDFEMEAGGGLALGSRREPSYEHKREPSPEERRKPSSDFRREGLGRENGDRGREGARDLREHLGRKRKAEPSAAATPGIEMPGVDARREKRPTREGHQAYSASTVRKPAAEGNEGRFREWAEEALEIRRGPEEESAFRRKIEREQEEALPGERGGERQGGWAEDRWGAAETEISSMAAPRQRRMEVVERRVRVTDREEKKQADWSPNSVEEPFHTEASGEELGSGANEIENRAECKDRYEGGAMGPGEPAEETDGGAQRGRGGSGEAVQAPQGLDLELRLGLFTSRPNQSQQNGDVDIRADGEGKEKGASVDGLRERSNGREDLEREKRGKEGDGKSRVGGGSMVADRRAEVSVEKRGPKEVTSTDQTEHSSGAATVTARKAGGIDSGERSGLASTFRKEGLRASRSDQDWRTARDRFQVRNEECGRVKEAPKTVKGASESVDGGAGLGNKGIELTEGRTGRRTEAVKEKPEMIVWETGRVKQETQKVNGVTEPTSIGGVKGRLGAVSERMGTIKSGTGGSQNGTGVVKKQTEGVRKQPEAVMRQPEARLNQPESVKKRTEVVRSRKATERWGRLIPGEVPEGLVAAGIEDEGFEVPDEVWAAVEGGAGLPELEGPLKMENYYSRMAVLYHMEEAQMQVDIQQFDQEVVLRTSGRDGFMMFELPGLAERKPSVAKGDKMVLSRAGRRKGGSGASNYMVYAHNVDLGKRSIYTQAAYFDADKPYTVQFTVRREPIVRALRSLELCSREVGSQLEHVLFPIGIPDRFDSREVPDFEPRDKDLNTEQRQAVARILQWTLIRKMDGKGFLPPYVIFGPPGTGKTKTMVEAVLQVLLADNKARILVCAPSNSAADNLLERLYYLYEGHFKRDVIRINSAGRPAEGVGALPEALKEFAPYNAATGFYTVRANQMRSQRVFITTCSAASLLHKATFKRGHFSHIFIDEAGHAVEPDCIVPIACFATRGTIVALAGDPQQLGPVVRSPPARQNGFGVSYLERLCRLPLYSPVDEAGRHVGYRSSVIRKLVRNYRSHPDILHIPSEIFYHGELDACADEDSRESLCQWSELPTRGFPIIFHGLAAPDDRDGDSPSWYNEGEIRQVRRYLQKLQDARKLGVKHSEIGVVAPFRRQVQKLQTQLGPNFSGVRVGTVEEFQGQEMRVIILTTVRGEKGPGGEPRDISVDLRQGLGFLGNRKRFNVAVTRAKELLIIIGNPHVLKQDPLWGRMLRYCIHRGGYQAKDCLPPPLEEIAASVEGEDGFGSPIAEQVPAVDSQSEGPEWPEPV